jgi:hypothetical protein
METCSDALVRMELGGFEMWKKLIAIAGVWLVFGAASAAADVSKVYPANKRPLDTSYADWAAEWGDYAFGVPNKNNPLINATNCDISIQAVGGAVMLPA